MLQTWRIRAGGLTAGAVQVAPKGDLVLVEVAAAETASTGGVLLPGSAQKKPTSGACRGSPLLAHCTGPTRQSDTMQLATVPLPS